MVYLKKYDSEEQYLLDLYNKNVVYGVILIKSGNRKKVKFIHKNRMLGNNDILLNLNSGNYSLFYEGSNGKPIDGVAEITKISI